LRGFLVRVGKPAASEISADNHAQFGGIYFFTLAHKVAHHFPPPQLTIRQGGNLGG
jgi:hypothetical protein